MIVLVGGTGFLGRHICDALIRRGKSAIAVSRRRSGEFETHYGNRIKTASIEAGELDAAVEAASHVIYLAHATRPGTSAADLASEVGTNTRAAAHFIDRLAALNPACPVTYISSGGQIYGRTYSAPIPETSAPQPSTVYGLGKRLIEELFLFAARGRIGPVRILRLANPVGRWQWGSGHGLVSAVARAALEGEPVTVFGDGGNQRDYFDADEFADFLCESGPPNDTGVFNIGAGRGLTERDVIAEVEAALQKRIDVRRAPARPFDVRYSVLDTSLARDALGWRPQTPLRATIAKLVGG